MALISDLRTAANSGVSTRDRLIAGIRAFGKVTMALAAGAGVAVGSTMGGQIAADVLQAHGAVGCGGLLAFGYTAALSGTLSGFAAAQVSTLAPRLAHGMLMRAATPTRGAGKWVTPLREFLYGTC